MAAIRVRVGAALDASVRSTFEQVSTLARRAGQTVDRELSRSGRGGGGWRSQQREVDALAKSVASFQRERAKDERAAARESAKAIREYTKEVEKQEREKTRAIEKASRERSAIQRREEREAQQRGRDWQARSSALWGEKDWRTSAVARIGGGVLGGLGKLAGAGLGMARDLAGGIGLDISPGSHIEKSVELERRSVELSNSAYMAGAAGPNGQRQDPKQLLRDVGQAANETATDTVAAMKGLQSFVGLTGDLDTGRKVFKDLAVLSKATGSNLDDMAAAAGNVANGLGEDVPDRAKAIIEVMQTIAGQGKLGAVEIKDMASQMAKLSASAGMFAGNRAENMGLMGALAQAARQRGGAASAQQAATAVQTFSNIFSKGARLKEFKFAGVDVFERDQKGEKTGRIKNAQQIITEALVHSTKGGTAADPQALSKMIMDANAKRVVRGFETIYRDKFLATNGTNQEKTAAAVAAVNEEFERLKKAAMGQGETMESFNRMMGTTESSVTQANNAFTEAAGEFMVAIKPAIAQVLPALGQLAIEAAKAAGAFAKFVLGITPDEETGKAFNEGKENALKVAQDMTGPEKAEQLLHVAMGAHQQAKVMRGAQASHLEDSKDVLNRGAGERSDLIERANEAGSQAQALENKRDEALRQYAQYQKDAASVAGPMPGGGTVPQMQLPSLEEMMKRMQGGASEEKVVGAAMREISQSMKSGMTIKDGKIAIANVGELAGAIAKAMPKDHVNPAGRVGP